MLVTAGLGLLGFGIATTHPCRGGCNLPDVDLGKVAVGAATALAPAVTIVSVPIAGPITGQPVEARSDTGKNSQKGDGGRKRAALAPVIAGLEKELADLVKSQGPKKIKDAIKKKIKNLREEGDNAAKGENHSQGNKI